tara:strand:- start:4292 stop:5341 length:1050 start_codon:yes stop_codon:yes gene_type:complete
MGLIKLPEESIQYFKDHVDEIFSSGNLAEGYWNRKLSKYVSILTKSRFCLPTSSNGTGLVSLLSLYRHFFNRNHVMIQSNTMYGVKAMVPASGCELSGYVNCQLETLMPSINDFQIALNPLTKKEKNNLIILLSHIGGIINPDILAIAELCRKEGIILLEDCAHSFGATFNGQHSGLFGDAGVYSFYATKAIPAGEGGLVVTDDETIGQMIEQFAIYDRFDQKLGIGNNIRVSELQALFTYSIIRNWQEIVNEKTKIATEYIKVCQKNKINYISQSEGGHSGNYYKFIIYSLKKPIKEAFIKLKTTTSPVYDYEIGFPNPLKDHHACLPIWYRLEQDVVKKVINELNKV